MTKSWLAAATAMLRTKPSRTISRIATRAWPGACGRTVSATQLDDQVPTTVGRRADECGCGLVPLSSLGVIALAVALTTPGARTRDLAGPSSAQAEGGVMMSRNPQHQPPCSAQTGRQPNGGSQRRPSRRHPQRTGGRRRPRRPLPALSRHTVLRVLLRIRCPR
jgi:hypothetical protein